MGRSHSSIFSFETLRPAGIPGGWLASVLIAVVAVTAAEIVARGLLAPLGGYARPYWDDSAAAKFEAYRHLAANGAAPDVVVIGDSTAARDFDPHEFAATADGLDAYNLGWPGNFALSLYESTAPVFAEESGSYPKAIVLMQAFSAYTNRPTVARFERPILNSWMVRFRRDPKSLDQRIALLRVYPAIRQLKRYWVDGDRAFLSAVPDSLGYMPKAKIGGAAGGADEPEENGEAAPRNADAFEPVRLATFDRWAEIARDRDIELLVVVPPRRSDSSPEILADYIAWLTGRAADQGVVVLDFASLRRIPDDAFRDAGHLNRGGAARFSRLLGKAFAACGGEQPPLGPCVGDWVTSNTETAWHKL